MSRPRTIIPENVLQPLLATGMKQTFVAEELGISVPTLSKVITELQEKRGTLLKYREIQSLQLTELQARILDHITPERIEEASLRDLVMCFKILKDKELVSEGKPSDIKGLVGYLIDLEKEELNQDQSTPAPTTAETVMEAEVMPAGDDEDDDLPKL